jgi:AcrR family transcriptional regulator
LSEQDRSANSRRYRMQKRAKQVDETRQRIVESTVRLHGTLGPAHTTIAGIARDAGVTRLTVYRHFPDDEAIFAACSAHWLAGQVLPDPVAWAAIEDPVDRLRAGLSDLYRFYRDGEGMLTRIYRDRDAMPEGRRRALAQRDEHLRDVLLQPFGGAGRRLRAMVGHAASFGTWRSLCMEQEVTSAEAVEVMVTLVVTATTGAGRSLAEKA